MAEFRRPLNVRIAKMLACMDGDFLSNARCCFGGGTQLVMAHGEFRESRDIDFLVSSPRGIRQIRETVGPGSLGKILKAPITLVRELVSERDAVRTYITDDPKSDPVKFEIIYEARIAVDGAMNQALGVPTLTASCAVAEKLLANADRGLDKLFRSRDVIDLAFACIGLDRATFKAGFELAEKVYGSAILRDLNEAIKRLELDAKYRSECVRELSIEDPKRLREGLAKLRKLKRFASSA